MSPARLVVAVVSTVGRGEILDRTRLNLSDGHRIIPVVSQGRGATANRLAAWQELAACTGATHGLLLADDLDACTGWRDAAWAFATRYPRQPLTVLHTTRHATGRDRDAGFVRVPVRQWAGDAAVLMPLPVVRRFLTWVRDKEWRRWLSVDDFPCPDRLLCAFHVATGTREAYVAAPPVFRGPVGASDWPGRSADAGIHFRRTLLPPAREGEGVSSTGGSDRARSWSGRGLRAGTGNPGTPGRARRR